ncbi:5-(carboxyamino)imidazole ribonucleotide synthase [Halioglobus pacificus]|uniref:N5-carboxyaminoimidazole ribonucleotide synthase n=1 Tax=Parahalioglobus pacificus TaxID=930806 RepID=A0A918XBL6_9GAMM|nr:ATP-grasp domain-containing protein [Halioglobus pacificus]GHD25124.1 N5-carboxyaminoimidazole ribonucleotide synthase [Halioglobus pacificus]
MSSSQHSAELPNHVGILGGGQLGMLLCLRARQLGIETTVLMDDAESPAAATADNTIIAPMDSLEAVARLINCSDVITFEFEAVNDSVLDAIDAAEARNEVMANPSPAVMRLLKDKGLQKSWLRDEALSTLPFEMLEAGTTLDDLLARPGVAIPFVQKARQGGYDGKGVQIIHNEEEAKNLWPVPSIVEPALIDCVEASVVVVRGTAGDMAAYPAVTMAFEPSLNAVATVISPGEISDTIAAACRELACRAVDALGSAGVFAVELFCTETGEVFINEISPRVHNSGHLTMDGFEHDQFEQHLLAITGRPLAPVTPTAPATVMLNLLYRDDQAPAHTGYVYSAALNDVGSAALHWYGKKDAKPGRKMGHINATGPKTSTALTNAQAALQHVRDGAFSPTPYSKETPSQ